MLKKTLSICFILFLTACSSQKSVRKNQTDTAGCIPPKNESPLSGNELIDAIRCSDNTKAASLIEQGADVNFRSKRGNTPLMWAVQRGNMHITKILVKKGADVNARDTYRKEPVIMWAIKKGHTEIVAYLIKHKARVSVSDMYKHTPLMDAAQYGHKEIVSMLINDGADVNARTDNGETSLIFAASNGHKEIVQYLIEQGADVNAVTNDTAESAYAKAKKSGRDEIAQIIGQQSSSQGEMAKRPYRQGDTEKVGKMPSMSQLQQAWGEQTLPDYLDGNEINRQMSLYLPGISQCLNQRIDSGDRNVLGRMNLDLRVAGNGKVVDVVITDEKYQSTLLGDCVIRVIKSKPFKMFRNEVMNFSFFYTF